MKILRNRGTLPVVLLLLSLTELLAQKSQAQLKFKTGIVCSVVSDNIMLCNKVAGQSVQPRKYVVNDYNGDGMSDLAIYNESQGLVSIYSLINGLLCNDISFGGPGWMPFPGDFNGDTYCDMAMYNYTSGDWYILINRTWQVLAGQLGGTGFVPAIADYDGDGVSDIGVYNVFTAYWYICSPTQGVLYWNIQFGIPYPDPQFDPYLDYPSIPVAADFDGDGKADPALYMNKFSNRVSYTFPNGWAVLYSRTKTVNYITASHFYDMWLSEPILLDNDGDEVFELDTAGGTPNVPLTGDYDGDGNREIASYSGYYRFGDGHWYIHKPDYSLDFELYFGNISFTPITEICSKVDQCIWGNLLDFWRLKDRTGKYDDLYIRNHKVDFEYQGGYVWFRWSGGIRGDEIWFINDDDSFNNDGLIYRGSISQNPIRIYQYINGVKKDFYFEFYR